MTYIRRRLQHGMILAGTPDRVFPLLCPIREYDWIESWRCEMIYSDSGIAELDCIFRTSFPADGPPDTWTVSRYEPPNLIEFMRVNPLRCIRYMIALRQVRPQETESQWSQIITALSGAGNDLVQGLTDEAYAQKMSLLQRMLNHYLTAGSRLDFQSPNSGGAVRKG
jgi:hypothetical protein